MGTKHRDYGKPATDGGTEGGEAALHRFAFWSHTDPAVTHGTGEGGVEAGMGWLEHASGAPDTITNVYIRNEANDGWVSILTSAALADHEHSGDDVLVTSKEESGATYTFVLADAGKWVEFTNGSAVVVTIPPNSSVAFPLGTQILIEQGSTGPVTVQGGSGVTLNAEGGKDTTVGQFAVAGIVKKDTDEWTLFGNVEAVS